MLGTSRIPAISEHQQAVGKYEASVLVVNGDLELYLAEVDTKCWINPAGQAAPLEKLDR